MHSRWEEVISRSIKLLRKVLEILLITQAGQGKKLQNFEKIKSNFAIIISEKDGNNYKGSIVVQAVRPVFNTSYESPLINIQDTKFGFEYVENENLIFNERQFSGKNLIDVISFYVYLILGYDADSFQAMGGTQWFTKAQQIAQNSQNRNYEGWSQLGTEGPRTRGNLISTLLNSNTNQLRNTFIRTTESD